MPEPRCGPKYLKLNAGLWRKHPQLLIADDRLGIPKRKSFHQLEKHLPAPMLAVSYLSQFAARLQRPLEIDR